jgi:hypothetical protein
LHFDASASGIPPAQAKATAIAVKAKPAVATGAKTATWKPTTAAAMAAPAKTAIPNRSAATTKPSSGSFDPHAFTYAAETTARPTHSPPSTTPAQRLRMHV